MATILLIDDSDSHRAEVRSALEGSSRISRIIEADDGLKGLKMLLEESVDIVLCDLELPGLDGDKLLRVRNANATGAQIPFLFITASTNVERKARLLDDGACDTIAKPVQPADLLARVHLHLKVKRLQEELREKNAALARMSSVDALTNLHTRRYVMDCLSIEFLRAKRYGTSFAVMMADLDHFKDVNDSFGHPGGDAVLRGVSALLLQGLRATDMAGRYGGDEIVAVFPHNAADGAAVAAERWRAVVAGTKFGVSEERAATVTVSVGIAAFEENFESPCDLVAAADGALYLAKQNGGNRIEIHGG